MDPRILHYYNRELQHLREMGGEFAREFPKIAGRLGLEGFECADPYVERLLEGFAFLAARVQLKLDAEFPRFTRHLLEMVCPNYLAPTPSMAMVKFEPEPGEGSLVDGLEVPRDTVLRGQVAKGDQSACEYRTAHAVTLWPLTIEEAEYTTSTRDVASPDGPPVPPCRALLRIRIRTTGGVPLKATALDRLPLWLDGPGELPHHIYEQLLADAVGYVIRPTTRPTPWHEFRGPVEIRRRGFDDDEALLPYDLRSFQGYRLIHEYFAFSDRFLFVEFGGLREALDRLDDQSVELVILLDRIDPMMENAIEASHFVPFASPAVNLFPKRADRINLTDQRHEYHVVPDRTRPMDYEVYSISEVEGHGTSGVQEKEFLPFYAMSDLSTHRDHNAYYTIKRVPRVLSEGQRRYGPRSSYVGQEVFLDLVDREEAPYHHDLRQLSLSTYCTNRDLPLHLPVGQGSGDFTLQASLPVRSVRCISGPTRPRPSRAEGEVAWRLVSHLSLNYLSLVDAEDGRGAAALREMLLLYGDSEDAELRKQVEGITSISSRSIHRRIKTGGPIAFGRGLEVNVTFDEGALGGSRAFLLGAVLERFFAKYVSLNSFTETVIHTIERGEVIRWPAMPGQRHTL
ncbi:MAG: type VI secretion system baseplate subunit TssF [Planctomycetota bacterium]